MLQNQYNIDVLDGVKGDRGLEIVEDVTTMLQSCPHQAFFLHVKYLYLIR